jgi:hypothetical protein
MAEAGERKTGTAMRVAVGSTALLFGTLRFLTRSLPDSEMLRPNTNKETRVEPSDTPLRVIGLLAGIFAGGIALAVVSLLLIFPHSVADQPKGLTASMPEPRLQPDPLGDMADYRADAQRRLHSYGWVDRDKDIVRLPIEEAMRRVVEHGIPDWPGGGR